MHVYLVKIYSILTQNTEEYNFKNSVYTATY